MITRILLVSNTPFIDYHFAKCLSRASHAFPFCFIVKFQRNLELQAALHKLMYVSMHFQVLGKKKFGPKAYILGRLIQRNSEITFYRKLQQLCWQLQWKSVFKVTKHFSAFSSKLVRQSLICFVWNPLLFNKFSFYIRFYLTTLKKSYLKNSQFFYL